MKAVEEQFIYRVEFDCWPKYKIPNEYYRFCTSNFGKAIGPDPLWTWDNDSWVIKFKREEHRTWFLLNFA